MTPPAPPVDSGTPRQTGVARERTLERSVFLSTFSLYAVWTLGVVVDALDALDALDASLVAPGFSPRSVPGQAAEAFALVTHPYVVLVVTLVLAARSSQQRQRRLALALGVAALGIPAWELQRALFPVDRLGSSFADSVSAIGSAYPAGHMVAATVLTWVVVTLANAQRRSATSQWRLRLLGATLVALVGVDQWAMGTQRFSELVGGLLFGVMVASAALWLSGVDTITRSWLLRELPEGAEQRAAIIYNPTKVLDLDLFRRRVTFAMARAGWDAPLWLETRRDDAGREMVRDALDKEVDLVVVAGGDGTARTVCDAMSSTGVPVALVPAGTGNLLGRNVGISLDEDEALDVALRGESTAVDLVTWTSGEDSRSFAVMAGVGLDAQIMQETDARLKKVLKGGAYVVAAAHLLRMPSFRATVTVDGVLRYDGDATMALVGNVGRLQGGIRLLPGASPTDGLIDVLVGSGQGVRGMARMALGIRRGSSTTLLHLQGRRVDITLDRLVPYQLDGDTEGQTAAFTAEVNPGALLLKTPSSGRYGA